MRAALVVLSGILVFICTTIGHAKSLVIYGDSYATGAASHPSVSLGFEQLRLLLSGELELNEHADYDKQLEDSSWSLQSKSNISHLGSTNREFVGGFSWFVDKLWFLISSKFLDASRHSWPYLLSSNSGASLVIAARDYESISSLDLQWQRLIANDPMNLPEDHFVYFSVGDLCSASLEGVSRGSDYKAYLESFIEKLNNYVEAHSLPALRLWLVEPMGLLQLVSRDEVLKKIVSYGDSSLSCKQLQSDFREPLVGQQDSQVDGLVGLLASNTPRVFCPSLFAVHGQQGTDINIELATRLLSYREAIQELEDEWQAKLAQNNIELRVLSSLSTMKLTANDIANDCFHLSFEGQLNVAKRLFEEMQKKR